MTKHVQSWHLSRSHDLGPDLSWRTRSRLNPESQYAYLLSAVKVGEQISSSRFISLGPRWSNGYDSGRLSRWPGRSGLIFEGCRGRGDGGDGGAVGTRAGLFCCNGGTQILPLPTKLRLPKTFFPVLPASEVHASLFASAMSDNPWADRSPSWLGGPKLFEGETWSVRRTSGASVRHVPVKTNEKK